jgi:hypothetical protein
VFCGGVHYCLIFCRDRLNCANISLPSVGETENSEGAKEGHKAVEDESHVFGKKNPQVRRER